MENVPRNSAVSVCSGLLFGLGWWLTIDLIAYHPEVINIKNGIVFLPILLSTISLFITSVIPNSSLYENFPMTPRVLVHRLVFFLGMTMGFAGVLSAVIVSTSKAVFDISLYTILGIILSNIFILAANIMFKFAMAESELVC